MKLHYKHLGADSPPCCIYSFLQSDDSQGSQQCTIFIYKAFANCHPVVRTTGSSATTRELAHQRISPFIFIRKSNEYLRSPANDFMLLCLIPSSELTSLWHLEYIKNRLYILKNRTCSFLLQINHKVAIRLSDATSVQLSRRRSFFFCRMQTIDPECTSPHMARKYCSFGRKCMRV